MPMPRPSLGVPLVIATLLTACEHDPLPGNGSGSFRADAYLGEWIGTWTNTTNNTSGPASFVVVRSGDSAITLTVDLGGNVFGAGDPVAESFVLSLGASSATLTTQSTATYGQLSGRLEGDGTVTANAVGVTVGNVRSFTLDGQWRANDIDLEVALTYAAGSTPDTARAVLRLNKR